MAVTLKEIAQKSGFSTSTVSHAISGRNPGLRPLSPDTIARIKSIAEKLGYRPNLLAAGLAQQKTYAIGVLVAMLRGDFYERILEGITDIVYPDFSPLLSIHGYDVQREKREIDMLIGKRVDGVIAACSGAKENSEIYRLLATSYSMPLVLVDRGLTGLDCPVVRGDHYKTAYLAARELAGLGHKRILYVTAGVTLESTRLFKQGYTEAMEEAGLEPLIMHYETGRWQRSVNKELASKVLDAYGEKDGFTAAICQIDWLAYEVLAECEKRGVKVPNDLSIMGLQDCEPSGLPGIALSTISVSFEEIGRKAASTLVSLINGTQVTEKTILIEPSVVMRKTTRAL